MRANPTGHPSRWALSSLRFDALRHVFSDSVFHLEECESPDMKTATMPCFYDKRTLSLATCAVPQSRSTLLVNRNPYNRMGRVKVRPTAAIHFPPFWPSGPHYCYNQLVNDEHRRLTLAQPATTMTGGIKVPMTKRTETAFNAPISRISLLRNSPSTPSEYLLTGSKT